MESLPYFDKNAWKVGNKIEETINSLFNDQLIWINSGFEGSGAAGKGSKNTQYDNNNDRRPDFQIKDTDVYLEFQAHNENPKSPRDYIYVYRRKFDNYKFVGGKVIYTNPKDMSLDNTYIVATDTKVFYILPAQEIRYNIVADKNFPGARGNGEEAFKVNIKYFKKLNREEFRKWLYFQVSQEPSELSGFDQAVKN